MKDKIVNAQKRGCFGCLQDLGKGRISPCVIRGCDVYMARERRMEGIRLHAKFVDPFRRTTHHGRIVIIEVGWRRANLDRAETAFADHGQAIKNALDDKNSRLKGRWASLSWALRSKADCLKCQQVKAAV